MLFNLIKSYILIIGGLFLYAFAWTAFLIPAKIIGGGVTGLSVVIFYLTEFPVGFSILIINVFLVLLGMRIIGLKFALASIMGILLTSALMLILPRFITEAIVEDRFMSALIGGALAGTGIGIAISNGGNSGGTEIIALIITKYKNISTGRILLYLDVLIVASSWLINRELETVVYGFVVMTVATYAIDLVLEGSKQSFQITIISDHSAKIASRIGNELGRGITTLKGAGWYSGREKNVLLCVCGRYDKQKILRVIDQTDPEAFITVGKVSAVFGENFDRIKL
ncbi:MAG: YitT family protein [Spirochaetales bacterium]|nr:YitT family protein [Spirochaetales bacterium]